MTSGTPETIVDVDVIEESSQELVTLPPPADLPIGASVPAVRALSVAEVAEHKARAREFMEKVMVKGITGDYAAIPGTGDKPTLLKPGAEKLARLFGLAIVRMERTMLEVQGDAGYLAGYHVALAGPDGRVWGESEAFAAEAEKTFDRLKRSTGGGPALLNTLTARAQKRAFVRAVVQSTGISDLFATDEGGVDGVISESQRELYVALFAGSRRESLAAIQATKIKMSKWEANVGSAVDEAADRLGWNDTQRDKVAELIVAGEITADELRATVLEGAA